MALKNLQGSVKSARKNRKNLSDPSTQMQKGGQKVTWQEMAMATVIGLAGGIVSGFFGVGGAVVIVPALTFSMGMSQHKAQGTSLASLLLPVGFLGFWEYYRKGNADVRLGLLIAFGLFFGAFLGAYMAQWLPSPVMRKLFGILLIAIGLRMLWR